MENLFQMLANAADGAFVVNKNQIIVYWNQSAQKILGYPPNKAIGRPCYEILRGCNDKGQAICRYNCRVAAAVFAGNPVNDYDLVTCTRSDQTRWINISILAISGNPDYSSPLIVHLFRDATQSKQNEQIVHQMFHNTDQSTDVDSPGPSSLAEIPSLTKREREVLTLLRQGLTTAEISESLSISPATVRNHIQSILHNLQAHSRLEAVVYALEHRLIS
ncbi:MAG: hypothetical protein FOGNACKC_06135 [Anaerolineae bacterium]|nr:hypothetical protein [Anaerolineae bacterium]